MRLRLRSVAGTMEPLAQSSEARFADYVDALTTVVGRGDRAGPLKDYCVGLLMPGERESVQPMAAVVAPARVSAKHQSLLHLVGQAAWSDEAVLAKVRELVLPAIEAQGKIEAWIADDTGFAKKGVHSVGVARQYCGRLGKTDNCQIAVTLSIANHAASLPIAYQLYLPQDWAGDEARRKKVRVPDEVKFRTKPEIALAQIRTALAAGVAPGVLLTDAGYGADGAFRSGVTASGLAYVVGVQSTLSVWPPGAEPLPPKPWSGRGRPPSRMRQTSRISTRPRPRGAADPTRTAYRKKNSIATIRRQLTVALARTLLRCPCCQAFPAGPPMPQRPRYRAYYVEFHMRRRLAPSRSTTTTAPPQRPNANPSWPRRSAGTPPCARRPPAAPTTECRCTASQPSRHPNVSKSIKKTKAEKADCCLTCGSPQVGLRKAGRETIP